MSATYNVGIIGGGFVGSAVAFGFGSSNAHDFNVRIHDIDPDRSTHTLEETVSESDFIFLCLPTPSKEDMSIDLSICWFRSIYFPSQAHPKSIQKYHLHLQL